MVSPTETRGSFTHATSQLPPTRSTPARLKPNDPRWEGRMGRGSVFIDGGGCRAMPPCPILSTFPVHSTHAMMSGGRKKRPLFNYCPPLSMSVREIRSARKGGKASGAGRRSKRTNYGICKSSRSSGSVASCPCFWTAAPPSLLRRDIIPRQFLPGIWVRRSSAAKGRTDGHTATATNDARSLARTRSPPARGSRVGGVRFLQSVYIIGSPDAIGRATYYCTALGEENLGLCY